MCENSNNAPAPYSATVYGVAGMENEMIIVINEFSDKGDKYIEYVDERDNKRKTLAKYHINPIIESDQV